MVSQNLFNTDMYEASAKVWAFGFQPDSIDQSDPNKEKVDPLSFPIFERNEIIVNPVEDKIDNYPSWYSKFKFSSFDFNYKNFYLWLLSSPIDFVSLSRSGLDIRKIYDTANLHYHIRSPRLNVWWIRSLHFCLFDINLKSFLVQVFKLKIKFFDNELIKYTPLIED